MRSSPGLSSPSSQACLGRAPEGTATPAALSRRHIAQGGPAWERPGARPAVSNAQWTTTDMPFFKRRAEPRHSVWHESMQLSQWLGFAPNELPELPALNSAPLLDPTRAFDVCHVGLVLRAVLGVQLLLGLYTAQAGTIRFGGASLEEIGLERVREHVAVVLQHPALFNDSVRANLTLGRERSDEACWR
eukprot:gene8794-10827_t